jgi:hypothetical protein
MKLTVLLLLLVLAGCAPDYRAKYFAEHQDTPPKVVELIESRKIAVGMTKDQVLASWGRPYRTTKTHYMGRNTGLWEYRAINDRYGRHATVVYFTGGQVAGWHSR